MQLVSLLRFLLCVALAVTPVVRGETAWPLPSVTPQAAGFSDEKLESLHRDLRQNIDAGKYSGYIMWLARDGKVVDWRAYGWQDVAAQVPMQKDSIVRIFSMTKVVTAVAVLMLLEDGRLKLSDPVEKYLPALKDRKVFTGGTADAPILVPANRPIILHDLLTHTSGYYYAEPWSTDFPALIDLFNRAKPFEAANLDEFVTRVAQLPLQEQPGTQFHYAIGFELLGAIVEKVSGQTFDVFLQQRIFGPLGMRDTGFWVPAEKRGRLALVYRRGSDGKLVPADERNQNNVGPGHGLLSGGGGLYSTAADYARFAQMLLNRGRLDDARILSRKTVELMTQNHIAHLANPHPFNKPEQGYGLGVRIMTDLSMSPNPGSLGCFGWDGAATTLVQMDPKEHTVAILLCQHVPFNQDDIFGTFINGYYSALND